MEGLNQSGGAEQAKNHKCMVICPFLYTFPDESGGGGLRNENCITLNVSVNHLFHLQGKNGLI